MCKSEKKNERTKGGSKIPFKIGWESLIPLYVEGVLGQSSILPHSTTMASNRHAMVSDRQSKPKKLKERN